MATGVEAWPSPSLLPHSSSALLDVATIVVREEAEMELWELLIGL